MSKKENLSQRQQQILDFISKKIRDDGYPPSVREIAFAVNLSSSATVHAHLNKLEEYGYIRRHPSKSRTIELLIPKSISTGKQDGIDMENTVYIPLIGSIAAGTPILAQENIEDYYPVSSDFARGNKDVFLLRVKGDSMVNAGILDRDYIIVRKQNTAINGDIIAALIDEEATVKRFFKMKSAIKLMPENDNMEPILTKDLIILGKVIGLIRKYF